MGETGKFVEPSLPGWQGACQGAMFSSVQFSVFFLVLFIFIHYMLPNQKSLSGINRNETWKIEELEQVSRLSAKVVKFLGQSRFLSSLSLSLFLSFAYIYITFHCDKFNCLPLFWQLLRRHVRHESPSKWQVKGSSVHFEVHVASPADRAMQRINLSTFTATVSTR